MQIELLNGDIREYKNGTTVYDIAKDISMGLAKKTLVGEIDGQLVDIRTPLIRNCHLKFLTFDDEGGKHTFWHSASHLMGNAIKRLWPDAQLTIGPAVDNGFYYDIDMKHILTAGPIVN